MNLPILLFYGFAFIGITHSVIFLMLALKNKRIADVVITLFMLAQSIIILEYVFYWTGLDQQYHYLCNISLTLHLLFGPLLLLYIDLVFSENKKFKAYLIHFVPATLIFAFMLPYYFSTADLKLRHYKMIKYFVLNLQDVIYFIMAHMSVYFLFILIKLIRERRVGYINNWLKLITSLFGFYIACYISYYIMVQQPWFTLTTDYFVSTGMCASIISIIYLAYARNKILDGYPIKESVDFRNIYFSINETATDHKWIKKKVNLLTQNYHPVLKYAENPENIKNEPRVEGKIAIEPLLEIRPDARYKNSGLTPGVGQELADALNHLMQKEKLYRESELKLETLAHKLGVGKHYVSQVINQHFGVNFFEFINILRIEEARQLLISEDKKSMNIIEIAYAVGFNTKNTFNTAFRRIVGVTPTEYRNQHQIKIN